MSDPKNKLMRRLVGLAYRFPERLRERIDEKIKSNHCVLAEGARLYAQSRIYNRQGRDAICVGRNSRILCRFETYAHGGRIHIGENCFIGENTHIWSAGSISVGDGRFDFP